MKYNELSPSVQRIVHRCATLACEMWDDQAVLVSSRVYNGVEANAWLLQGHVYEWYRAAEDTVGARTYTFTVGNEMVVIDTDGAGNYDVHYHEAQHKGGLPVTPMWTLVRCKGLGHDPEYIGPIFFNEFRALEVEIEHNKGDVHEGTYHRAYFCPTHMRWIYYAGFCPECAGLPF